MHAKAFRDGDMLKIGWHKTWRHFGVLLGALVVAFLVTIIPSVIAQFTDNFIVQTFLMVLYLLLIVFFSIGMIRIILDIVDEKEVEFAKLFSGYDVLLPFIGVLFIIGLIKFVGFFFLIFPAIIFGLMFMFAPMLVIDQKLGPIEAMKKSFEMTNGFKWDLLGFVYLVSIVVWLGALALGIGLFATVPMAMIATAAVYRHLGPKKAKK